MISLKASIDKEETDSDSAPEKENKLLEEKLSAKMDEKFTAAVIGLAGALQQAQPTTVVPVTQEGMPTTFSQRKRQRSFSVPMISQQLLGPVCSNCRQAGHVFRFCPYKQMGRQPGG